MDLLAHWPRWSRRLLAFAVGVAVFALLIRLLIDPIFGAVTRRQMSHLKGVKGDFDHVHVTVFGPGYTITRLKLTETPVTEDKEPLFYAESTHLGLDWRQLLHGHIVARVRVIEPKAILYGGKEPAPNKPRHLPNIAEQLKGLTSVTIDRIEILRGELLFRDVSLPHHPELWVHHLELAAENLSTRQVLDNARAATLAVSGTVGHSGHMRVFVSADPFANPLEFAGRFDLQGLRAAELYEFIEPKTKLQPAKGTIDLFAEFQAKNGRLDGGVKPVLKNVEVEPTTDGIGKKIEAWLANVGIKLSSDRVPERNAVATVVPIQGRFTDPKVELWPAVFGVIRNSFVQGIASGYRHLPPPKAAEKQGVLKQVKDALDAKQEAPKAQPTEGQHEAAR